MAIGQFPTKIETQIKQHITYGMKTAEPYVISYISKFGFLFQTKFNLYSLGVIISSTFYIFNTGPSKGVLKKYKESYILCMSFHKFTN